MKNFLTTLLILTSLNSMANATKVISAYCNYNYAEGIKIERTNGRIVRECILKSSLEDEYYTSVDTACIKGFTVGRKFDYSANFDTKVCHRISTLGEVYEVSTDEKCAPGYDKDRTVISYTYDYDSNTCIRSLN